MFSLSRFLYRYTANKPCRLIKREDRPYLERYWLFSVLGVTAYLHRFVTGEAYEDMHDHPWSLAIAIVLSGWYLEKRLLYFDAFTGWKEKGRFLRVGKINIIRGKDFHKIVIASNETWTLFIHLKRIKGWGFIEKQEDGSVKYHQPGDITKVIDWQNKVPLGKDQDRELYSG